MASIRERIIAAMAAALDGPEKPEGVTVHRDRTRPIERDKLPAIVLYAASPDVRTREETVRRSDHDTVERTFTAMVEGRVVVRPDESPDAAIDPLYVWTVKALRADPTLGGLAMDVRETGTDIIAAEFDKTYAAFGTTFEVVYFTAEDDPEVQG